MTFVHGCVGFVITLLLGFATWILGALLMDWDIPNNDDAWVLGWLFSTIGFGVCLTILLYQNGVL